MQEMVKNTVDAPSGRLAEGVSDGAKEIRPSGAEKPKHTRKTPRHDQVIHATKLLSENGVWRTVAPPRYDYSNGWSDQRVRDTVGEPMTVDKVALIRRAHFGPLECEIPVEPDPGNVGKLREEAAREEIAKIVADLLIRIAKMEKTVAAQRSCIDALLNIIKLPVQTRLEV